MATQPGAKAPRRASSAAIYVALFVLGAVLGIVGSFQYGQSPAPLVAIGIDVLILVSCLFGGWGTRSLGGTLAVAVGWALTSFFLSMGTRQGSVIITNTAAGEWYLYGGTLAVFIAAIVTFVVRTRSRVAGSR